MKPGAGLARRVIEKSRRRIIPRCQWAARARDYSTIALGLSAAIVAAWATIPQDWMPFLPTEWVAKGTGVLSLIGLVGKFITQPQRNKD